jgi:DNA-binding NarL/FixJ family response regulator
MASTRVVLVDHHPCVREWIQGAVRQLPDLILIASTGCGAEALYLVERHVPDARILDIDLPQQAGLHLLQNLPFAQVGACHREHREKRDEATMTSSNLSVNSVRSVARPRTLIFSDRADAPTVEQALAYGVDAYLTKDATTETLFAALRGILRGERHWFSPVIVAHMASVRHAQTSEEANDCPLTARERDVLSALAQGWSNRRIAEELRLSERTVKFHLSNIYGKLAVSDRAEALVHAVRRGWVEIEREV